MFAVSCRFLLLQLALGYQLQLLSCSSSFQASSLVWHYENSNIILNRTGECVTYNSTTTNIETAPCVPGSVLQEFEFRGDGTIFNPSTGFCWDSQYYSNSSGSGLGLFTCYAGQLWDHFSWDSVSGKLIYGVDPSLCVNGGAPPPPLPTPQQLAWMDMEVSLMISYDMITHLTEVPNPQHFCIQAGGDSSFAVPPATRFNPSNETFTDSWIAAAQAANAKYTLLVASHCSGFFQWQTSVKLPDGSPYPYTVAQSYWKGGKGDVVEDYVQSSKAAGLGFGFYLTWNYNYLFNWGPSGFSKQPLQPGQINVTQEEFRAMMTAQMEEVWSRYSGAITEIWFDGGENNVAMNDLIKRLQPQAIAADGTAPPNFARLVGSESGFAPYPVWSTANAPAQDGSGDPAGGTFCPPEADTPVAERDAWFWKPGQTYRPAQELQSVYKNTVGANSLLELGVLPDDTGSIPADQMAVLQSLGDYIRTCHSPEAAIAATNGTGASLTLTFASPQYVNRVIIQEDLTQGQLVRAFSIYALSTSGWKREPILVASGTAIGHKRILYFFSGPILSTGLTITVTEIYPGFTQAYWRNFAAYTPCSLEQ